MPTDYARVWEKRAKASRRDLDTVTTSLDATIDTLDKLAAHLRELRALINRPGHDQRTKTNG